MDRAESWQSHRLDLVQGLLMVELDGAIRARRHVMVAPRYLQGVTIFLFSKKNVLRSSSITLHGVDVGGGVATAQDVVDMQTHHSDQTTVQQKGSSPRCQGQKALQSPGHRSGSSRDPAKAVEAQVF